MLELLMAVRAVIKANKKAAIFKAAKQIQNEEIIRNAAAYAFEVGRGAPLAEELTASADNPFLDPAWRSRVGS